MHTLYSHSLLATRLTGSLRSDYLACHQAVWPNTHSAPLQEHTGVCIETYRYRAKLGVTNNHSLRLHNRKHACRLQQAQATHKAPNHVAAAQASGTAKAVGHTPSHPISYIYIHAYIHAFARNAAIASDQQSGPQWLSCQHGGGGGKWWHGQDGANAHACNALCQGHQQVPVLPAAHDC